MTAFLFAAAWDDFFKILPFIIVVVVWVINQFAGKQQPPQPPGKRLPPIKPPAPLPRQQAAPPGQQPLQAEIEEFLRQAQSLREGRPAPQRNQPVAGGQPAAGAQRIPPGAGRRPRPARRTQPGGTQPPAAPAPEAPTPERPRESVAQYVAEHTDSSKFDQRATKFGNIERETDEFQQHMQRVFEHGVGKLEKGPLGLFEAAGAAAAAVTAAALTSATASAAGAETATAPTATRKAASNIAVFLSGRKNIRDAIILTEILQRPEHRW